MRISDETIQKLLERSGVATEEQIAALKQEGERARRPLQNIVLTKNLVDEKRLTQLYAEYAQIPFIELNPHDIPTDVLSRIPERVAKQYNAVLFRIDADGTQHMAMEDPDDVQAVNFLQKELGVNTKIYLATRTNVLDALQGYHDDVNEDLSEVIDTDEQAADEQSDQQSVSDSDVAENSPIAKTVNLLLEYAVRSRSSDIHIEPRQDYVQIRYRIDGVLREVNRLPRKVLGSLISRIKIMSNLKIDEKRVPQDGRFKITVAGKQYALRVSSMPVADGEKVAIRILDESNQAVSLEELGYWGHSLDVIKLALTEPNGMVLVTGPTGSGKSTSLFSVLTMLNQPNVNIATIEDPVEYRVPGVNQTQTNDKAGMTFASGLRAMLRQDPNIIMVGEIRDGETANLGVQAALTGHLVFSTLHTNNAATCLPRLLDMGIEPFLIASTIRAVVGQRLVRQLNPKTRISYMPDEAEKAAVFKLFGLTPGQDFTIIHELEKRALAEGVGKDLPLSTDEHGIKSLWKADDNDNTEESNGGYEGRIGIYEVLANTAAIQKLIIANATSAQIQAQAIQDGMMTMQLDGLIKALRGQTTIEEVLRVSKD